MIFMPIKMCLPTQNFHLSRITITDASANGVRSESKLKIFQLKTYWFEKHIGNSDFITFGVLSSWALTIVCPICPISPVNNVPIFDQNDKIFILSIFFLLWFQFLSLLSIVRLNLNFWTLLDFRGGFIFLTSTDRNTLVVFNLNISGFGFAPFLKIYEYHSCPVL